MMKLLLPTLSIMFLTQMKARRLFFMTGTTLLLLTPLSLLMFPLFHTTASSHWFHMDHLSSPLITLTLWIFALSTLASQPILINAYKPKKFCLCLISLALFLILAFLAHQLIAFYLFFEASLLATLFLILGWGKQPERLQASSYLLLYTVTASLPLLWAILSLSTWNISVMMLPSPSLPNLPTPLLKTWWLAMLMAFFVKTPIYSTHLWLPKAHVEAPVAGSMILAAIMLKLGTYGIIRVSSMFLPLNQAIKPLLMSLTLMGAALTSLICLRQTDIKALIAYSSVAHMGAMTSAMLTNTQWAWQGALVMMIAHALTSSGLFAMSNILYEAFLTRSLFLTKGLLSLFPSLSLALFLLAAANMAAPPTPNLLSELCIIPPLLATSLPLALPMALLTLVGGAYSLVLYTAITHGPPPTSSNPMFPLHTRNLLILLLHILPLLLLIIKPDTMVPWI